MNDVKRYAIAIDFDGVIHQYDKGYQDGTLYGDPKLGAFDAIKQLLEKYNVFILSTRTPGHIAAWLLKHDAPFEFDIIPDIDETPEIASYPFYDRQGVVGITQRKLAAIRYVDDRAVEFDARNGDEWSFILPELMKAD